MVKWNFENNEKSMEILMIKPSLHSHGKLSDFQNNEQNSDYWIMTGCSIVMLKKRGRRLFASRKISTCTKFLV